MYRLRQMYTVVLLISVVSIGITAAQRRPYRLTDRQIGQIVRSIETRSGTFRASLDAALDQSRLDGTSTEDEINRYVRDFENATDTLRDRFNSRRSLASDVETVLNQAANIDDFMRRNSLSARAQNDWGLLRSDLNALANAYGVAWRWDMRTYPTVSGGRPSRINDRQVQDIMRRLETDAKRFRVSLDNALDRSRLDATRAEDRINDFVRDFENATDALRDRFNNHTSVAADVETVLSRAASIDDFMRRNPLTARAQNDWSTVRSDLNGLAGAYNVAWRWDNPTQPAPGGASGTDARLTGTFRLDPSRSDVPRDVADRATRNLPSSERQRVYDAVVARLGAPEMLAIERSGLNVTVISSRAPQTTFAADGQERVEQLPNGVTARVRATLNGDQLLVSSTGYRENDFSVTFNPTNDGRGLHVTREIFSDRLPQPVVVHSLYDRTSDVAQWNIYDGMRTFPTGAGGDFIVRDGEMLVAVLDSDVSTTKSQEGERFRMTVRSPAQYEGAVIEGTISDISRSGRISGRSGVTFNFDSIRMRNGQTYRFAGLVDSVRTTSGETVRVDNEGAVKEGSQTSKTVQRTAIGTGIGAIIGAITGGGKGAAIGAVIGAGVGAGSVYVQGPDDVELLSGTEVTIRASAPVTAVGDRRLEP